MTMLTNIFSSFICLRKETFRIHMQSFVLGHIIVVHICLSVCLGLVLY